MKQRLERSGLRSISAVVDITNYVMLELGQPLHAYDDRLLDGAVVVRFAREGEKLTLLNGQVLDLESDLLLVADEKKPLGLAGIMGGEHSGIADDTTRVYLEGAFWNPTVIQGKMRRLGFTSDAGYRFERGVDFEGCARAVERATQLIIEVCGGRAGPLTDAVAEGAICRAAIRCACAPRASPGFWASPFPPTRSPMSLRASASPFTRDGADLHRDAAVRAASTSPSKRISSRKSRARIHGYDKIPAAPSAHVQHMLPDPRRNARALAYASARWSTSTGRRSSRSASCRRRREAALDPAAKPIAVLNPIAAQLDVMRTSLLPGLIETLTDQREPQSVARAHLRAGPHVPSRRSRLRRSRCALGGLGISARPRRSNGATPTRDVDFFDVKGDLEALAAPRHL